MVKNRHYKKFLQTSYMRDFLTIDELTQAIDKISGIDRKEWRALFILLFWTGCRPVEALNMYQQDVRKKSKEHKVECIIPGAKGGKTRPVDLLTNRKHVPELEEFARNRFPGLLLFYNLRGSYIRQHQTQKGTIKEYQEITGKVRYMCYKITRGVGKFPEGIPPYYFRHNRFSQMAENGASAYDILQVKGGKSLDNALVYMNMSTKERKKLSRLIS